MNRDEAIQALKPCGAGHWHCGVTCDGCWVNEHRCPPTMVALMPQTIAALKRATEIGREAERMLAEIRKLGLEAKS